MSENDTGILSSIESDSVENFFKSLIREDRSMQRFYTIQMATHSTMAVLSTATLIYGVTSWCIIKKFRNYKNFVFLNAVLANILGCLAALDHYYIPIELAQIKSNVFYATSVLFIQIYAITVRNHWVIVICCMFYMEIVQVFNAHVRKKYLKSSLFIWGASFITTSINISGTYVSLVILESVKYFINLTLFLVVSPVILNCVLYILIVCSLWRTANAHTATSKWVRLYIATVIFLLSDLILLYVYVLSYIYYIEITDKEKLYFIQLFLHHFSPVLMNIYLIIVKENRVVWYDYYVRKLNQRRVNRDMKMQYKTVATEPLEGPPVV